MKKLIHVANMALINSDHKILLLKRSDNLRKPGIWGCPGGMVDPGEDQLQAAKRELYEETGIDVNNYSITGQEVFLAHATDEDIEITLFKADLISPVEIILDPFEHSDYGWFDLATLEGVENIMSDIPKMISTLLAKKSIL
jgi:8-oxo-dGTP pyrophosphatase MutT (NUDIX family)